jgi:hypothetical protein
LRTLRKSNLDASLQKLRHERCEAHLTARAAAWIKSGGDQLAGAIERSRMPSRSILFLGMIFSENRCPLFRIML